MGIDRKRYQAQIQLVEIGSNQAAQSGIPTGVVAGCSV
jgi:hypothetical protein